MLKHLRITNFAILSDVALDLAPGLNVLTGETGAGKSLIVDAVALLRGARASSDIPRAGADEAVVEAIFAPPPDLLAAVAERLERAGLASGDDGELLVRRVISARGRSRIHVNGGLTSAAVLAELGGVLVELAGQHEHQGLVDPARHAVILDAFGVDAAIVARAERAHAELREIGETLAGLAAAERDRAAREDFLRFQVQEIDEARLRPGEDAELPAERDRLRAASRLAGAARHAEEALYSGEGAVLDALAGVVRELGPLVAIDPRLGGPRGQLEEARLVLEDAAVSLRRYADGVRDDPARLAEIEDRLHAISRLCRKHGATAAEVLARRDAMAAELEGLAASETRRAELAGRLDAARAEAGAAAAALTAARRAAGARLGAAVTAALAELGMASARLEVLVEARPARDGDGELAVEGRRLGPRGWDRVELLLAANRGEEARPLARVASGGELSRVMLALKLCLRRAGAVATHVFDEVDAGIGGATAEVVGRQIRRVAELRQVVCVTHHAQIAAMADAHFRVEKTEEGGRTETVVARLSEKARKDELARMIGGVTITPRARAHAAEMLAAARRA